MPHAGTALAPQRHAAAAAELARAPVAGVALGYTGAAVTYDKMSDEVLTQIAEGNGHCYRHEAKAMARELIEFRAERAAGTKTPQQSLVVTWSPPAP